MSDAPERIWTSTCGKLLVQDGMKRWPHDVEYVRADTLASLSAERDALRDRVDELNEIAKVAIRAAKDANDVLIELRAELDATKDQRG